MRYPRCLLPVTVVVAAVTSACLPGPGVMAGPYPVGVADIPPGITSEAWTHALAAYDHAWREGIVNKPLLTIIDFSLPSSERRLWVVNLATRETLAYEHVAHGVRSGGEWATQFSNLDGSNESSLGAFVTANRYVGVRGLSLRLQGLEPGINDRAWARGIVFHGTPNVSADRARRGTMGRTEGCPAVSMEAARRLIPMIEDGVLVFAWAPDRQFIARSEYLDEGQAAIRLSGGS